MNITLSKNDEIVMKLIHYFITEQGYNPIVLHGAKDEIWLENSDNEYQIVRIVTNYIHNDEQFDFDLYRTRQIIKRIKQKTFSFKMNALSIFINLGENVHLSDMKVDNIDCIEIKEIDDINHYEFVVDTFPNINKIDKVTEKGLELFMKLTDEINQKNQEDAEKAEDVFSKKRPVVTYALLISNIVLFLTLLLCGSNPFNVNAGVLYNFGGLVNFNTMGRDYFELYRLITSLFLHASVIQLLFNIYALYVIGPQIESFFGKFKFTLIYLGSGIISGLLGMLFLPDNVVGIGASGALFGLIGSLLYFGYHYRVYLGTVIKSQIIPLIILNGVIALMLSKISLIGYLGGIFGGILVTKAVGVKYKSTVSDRVNGIIMTLIFVTFLCYVNFFY